MRTIPRQTLASTKLDKHGEKLTKEQLHSLYEQMPTVSTMNHEHDLSRPPVAVAHNKQFIEIGNGEFAIVADIDVTDEQAFARAGGFSVAYSVKTVLGGAKDHGDIRIRYNRRYFDEDFVLEAVSLSDHQVQIDAVEIKQKAAASEVAILTLTFISLAAASGFFGQIGADAYRMLKEWIKELARRRREAGEDSAILHFVFPAFVHGRDVEVVVLIAAENIEIVSHPAASEKEVTAFLESTLSNKRAKQIVVQPSGADPFWSIVRIIESEGLAEF